MLASAGDVALSLVGRVVNGVIAQVDMNALLAQVDMNALLAQVDLDALMESIDLDGLLARTEMGSLIVRSTSGVASEALDVVRSGAVGIDGAIGRTVDRVLRRSSSNGR